jgi:NAD-dependent deacetylase
MAKRGAGCWESSPNTAHFALANWQQKWGEGRQITLVTQNVDGLHQKAGSDDVIEIHGSLLETRCTIPGCESKPFLDLEIPESVPLCAVCGHLLAAQHHALSRGAAPRCHHARQARATRLRFVSLDWHFGCGFASVDFVRGAAYAGARTIYLNLTPLESASPFEENIIGRAEEILPEFLD